MPYLLAGAGGGVGGGCGIPLRDCEVGTVGALRRTEQCSRVSVCERER